MKTWKKVVKGAALLSCVGLIGAAACEMTKSPYEEHKETCRRLFEQMDKEGLDPLEMGMLVAAEMPGESPEVRMKQSEMLGRYCKALLFEERKHGDAA